jgi:hypothetical protein
MSLRLVASPLLLLLACSNPTGTQVDFRRAMPSGTSGGPMAARFGKDTITVTELNQRFAEMNPYARARYQTLEQRPHDRTHRVVPGQLGRTTSEREAVDRGREGRSWRSCKRFGFGCQCDGDGRRDDGGDYR